LQPVQDFELSATRQQVAGCAREGRILREVHSIRCGVVAEFKQNRIGTICVREDGLIMKPRGMMLGLSFWQPHSGGIFLFPFDWRWSFL
jgi:hypothetical protein